MADVKLGVDGQTVTVMEPVPQPYPEVKRIYSFAELREIFEPGSLVYMLLDEIERLQHDLIRSIANHTADLNRQRYSLGLAEDSAGGVVPKMVPHPGGNWIRYDD